MKATRTASMFTLLLLLAACVTINIYFPAAAAEKAADRIIEDVWGKRPEAEKPAAPTPQETPREKSGSTDRSSYGRTGLALLLDLLVPPAHAQADINISSPAIQKITASMQARHGRLAGFYASGAVGLTADGLVAVRDPNAVPLKERNAVRQLVAEENNDRNALYREIARANGHPEWEGEIRSTFARRWIDNASSGWWYQDASGSWKQK